MIFFLSCILRFAPVTKEHDPSEFLEFWLNQIQLETGADLLDLLKYDENIQMTCPGKCGISEVEVQRDFMQPRSIVGRR